MPVPRELAFFMDKNPTTGAENALQLLEPLTHFVNHRLQF